MDPLRKITQEKQTVAWMIRFYCTHKENHPDLCPDCQELLIYAHQRLDCCRYKNKKKSCKHCKTHCYNPLMRDKIRRVMRFSGPRLLFFAPIQALRHWLHL